MRAWAVAGDHLSLYRVQVGEDPLEPLQEGNRIVAIEGRPINGEQFAEFVEHGTTLAEPSDTACR